MSIENDATLEFYAKHADLYQRRNVRDYATTQGLKDDETHAKYILATLAGLPLEAKLFEVGSGTGRDAALIRSRGYQIQTSDAVESFLDILRENGFNPVKFNLISDSSRANMIIYWLMRSWCILQRMKSRARYARYMPR